MIFWMLNIRLLDIWKLSTNHAFSRNTESKENGFDRQEVLRRVEFSDFLQFRVLFKQILHLISLDRVIRDQLLQFEEHSFFFQHLN